MPGLTEACSEFGLPMLDRMPRLRRGSRTGALARIMQGEGSTECPPKGYARRDHILQSRTRCVLRELGAGLLQSLRSGRRTARSAETSLALLQSVQGSITLSPPALYGAVSRDATTNPRDAAMAAI